MGFVQLVLREFQVLGTSMNGLGLGTTFSFVAGDRHCRGLGIVAATCADSGVHSAGFKTLTQTLERQHQLQLAVIDAAQVLVFIIGSDLLADLVLDSVLSQGAGALPHKAIGVC